VGVIGAKPIHLQPADQRDKVVKKQDMYIDIGPRVKRRLKGSVCARVIRSSRAPISSRWLMAKHISPRHSIPGGYRASHLDIAIDPGNRASKHSIWGSDSYGRGGSTWSTTSVRAIDPDVAIVLESDIAGDIPASNQRNHRSNWVRDLQC